MGDFMSRENNFPIKYAVLELKEEGGYITNYKDIVRGYIVSKCWVVESSIKYFPDGSSKIFHNVIFPYKDLDTLKTSLRNDDQYIGERVTINYDFNYNPYPVDVVSELFDSYEDAKTMSEEKNKELKGHIASEVCFSISDPRFIQTLSNYKHKFEEQLSICQLFEKLSLLKTEDMIITEDINQDKNLQLLKSCK